MSNIYEIQKNYLDICNTIIENGGEVTENDIEALAINKEQLQNKGISYGYVIKSLESDVSAIDEEIKRLNALKSSRNKTVDLLKNTIKDAMQMYGIEEIKTATLKINFRKSESVEVETDIIDDEYCNFKTVKTPDKTKIKEVIKNGDAVIGASLNINWNIQIK